MQQQIDDGDYILEKRKEKTLLDRLHKKLIKQLRIMEVDLDDFKEKRKYLVSAPVLGHMYLLIKVHKKNFLGRAVVSQIDDPTYKICTILIGILNPLAINGQSFAENSYDLDKTLAMIQVDKDYLIHLQLINHWIVSERLQSGNQMILSIYSKFASKLISRLWMAVFSHKQTEHPLENRYQVLLQTSI